MSFDEVFERMFGRRGRILGSNDVDGHGPDAGDGLHRARDLHVSQDREGQGRALACLSCRSMMTAGSKLCRQCGRSVISEAANCPKCGLDLPRRADFCMQCGTKLNQQIDSLGPQVT